MNHGRVEQLDTPAAIYERPATRFVAGFIGLTNLLRGVVEGREGGALVVRTADGARLRAEPADAAAPGTTVEVAVRPEKIQMGVEEPRGADNCVEGRVAAFVYQGVVTEYQVELRDGQKVRVIVQNLRETWGSSVVPEGSRVYLHWPRGAGLVLADTGMAHVETGDEDDAVAAPRR
jgi:spermidine/putrescine transport system ATP-binding protein